MTGLQVVLTSTPHTLAAVYSHPFTTCPGSNTFCTGVSTQPGRSLILNHYSWTGSTYNRLTGFPLPINSSVATTTTFNWSATPTTFPGRLGVDGTGAIFWTDQFNGAYWQKSGSVLKNTCEKIPLSVPCDPVWAPTSCNTAGCTAPGMSAIAISANYVFIGFADRSSGNLWRLNLGSNPPFSQIGGSVSFGIADIVYKTSTNELWVLGFQNNRVARLGTSDDWQTATILSNVDWTASVPSGLQLTSLAAGQDSGPQSLQFNFVWALAAPSSYTGLASYTGDFAILNVEGTFPVCMDPGNNRRCIQVTSVGCPGGSSSCYALNDGTGFVPRTDIILPSGASIEFGAVSSTDVALGAFAVGTESELGSGTTLAQIPTAAGFVNFSIAARADGTAVYYYRGGTSAQVGWGGRVCWVTCPVPVTSSNAASVVPTTASNAACGSVIGGPCCVTGPSGDRCNVININSGCNQSSCYCGCVPNVLTGDKCCVCCFSDLSASIQ